jgi:ribose-phosphate pyrophosphokinase
MTTPRTVVALPGNEALAAELIKSLGAATGTLTLRSFPDGETYVRMHESVVGQEVVIACSLDRPDSRVVPLYLLGSSLREQGAARVLLAAPYLAYMRQDREFQPGESVSARHFARWLSGFIDGLVTVDPHLHRIHKLSEIYRIPVRVVAAASNIAHWIALNVASPLVIGPDAESAQWVAAVAGAAGCPYTVLEKRRRGDRDVEVSIPEVARWRDRTPVLVDDIVSTARTMIAAVSHLRSQRMAPPVCVAVHAVFAGSAYGDLRAAGAARIVSCNTISHVSNAIDVLPRVAAAVAELIQVNGPATALLQDRFPV